MTARTLSAPAVVLLAIGTALILSLRSGSGRARLEEAGGYDLSRYRITDARLVGYDEEPSAAVDGDAPGALTVNGEGTVFVAAGSSLLVYDGTGGFTEYITLSGEATALAAGPSGRIYAAVGTRIETVTAEGDVLPWTSLGERAIITSLAAGPDSLYAADAGNGMVWRFDGEGRLKGTFGRRNLAGGEMGFIVPSPYFDLALAADGTLWVANPGRLRVERYTPEGRLIDFWGTASLAVAGFGGCCNPSHLALLPEGSLVTSEKGLPRVKVYGADGTFKSMVAGPGSFRAGTVGLDLAVDGEGRVFVVDPARGSLRTFVPRSTAGGEADGS